MEKLSTITEESIKLLVDRFYNKVRSNKELAPLFENEIGVSDSDWLPHLKKMYDFWSSVMLTSGRYHGNPMKKHKDLPEFDIKMFDRWLELFAETASEVHTPDIAGIYMAKAERIAGNLKFNIYQQIIVG